MASPAPTWELADQNLAPFRCSREEILRPPPARPPGPPFTADAALFQLWSGVFAGVIVESRALRPDMFLHVYIVAFNLSASPQTHALVPGKYKIPDEQRHLLTFS